MKKLLLTLFTICLVSLAANAQHCVAATTSISPIVGSAPGLSPTPQNLPCADSGSVVSDTIYFKNYNMVSGFTVNSLKLDSINNLPAGLCWVSNKANNTFNNSEDGVIYVSGTCAGNPGQYKLRIHVTVNLSIIGTQSGDAEALAGLRYYVRVKCPSATCPAIDSAGGVSNAFIAYPHCGSTSSGVTASVTPVGPVTLCPNHTQLLSANTGTGYTYRWSTGATASSITASAAGSYFVTVYSGVDSAVSNTVVVTLGTLPDSTVTPSSAQTICLGDSVCLTAAAGLTYHWSDFGGTTTRTLCTRFPGTYKVTVTNSGNCSAVSIPVTVTLGTGPTVTVTRSGFVLTATTTAIHFQWYMGTTLLVGDTMSTLTVTQNGTYTVAVSNATGCKGYSTPQNITNVGILDIYEHNALNLYPNPTSGSLTVSTAGLHGAILTVYDNIGRVVKQQTISLDKTALDMSGETEGMYIVSVKSQDAIATARIVVIK